MATNKHHDDRPQRVGLFGGTGFVGGYLVDALLENAMHPVLLVRAASTRAVPRAEHCIVVRGDIGSIPKVGNGRTSFDLLGYGNCPKHFFLCQTSLNGLLPVVFHTGYTMAIRWPLGPGIKIQINLKESLGIARPSSLGASEGASEVRHQNNK